MESVTSTAGALVDLDRGPIVVDARGQSCPGPLVSVFRALKEADRGDLIELLATDPGSLSDVPAWAKLSGNELVEQSQEDGHFRYLLRKA